MALYTFRDLTLEVNQEAQETKDLDRLLQELSWVRTDAFVRNPSLCLSVSLNGHGLRVPRMAREVFRADGFRGLEAGDGFYLTDGSSLFHLQTLRGKGYVKLAPSFFQRSLIFQRNFWAFGLLKLLRPLGAYSLHAAGLVTREGLGILIVGGSGSGKSTLAIGLIRQGWGYLCDDAVLLRLDVEVVEALAFRKNFYVDAKAVPDYPELPLGEEMPDASGGRRRRVLIERAYPGQYVRGCIPHVLLFSRIVPSTQSTLFPLDRHSALKNLLKQSGPQLFDRRTMTQHLELLKRLVQQSACYELRAGLDLYHNPLTVVNLLAEAEGAEKWRGLL